MHEVLMRRLQCQPGFADAAGTGQRDKTAMYKQLRHGAKLIGPAYQPAGSVRSGPERGKISRRHSGGGSLRLCAVPADFRVEPVTAPLFGNDGVVTHEFAQRID